MHGESFRVVIKRRVSLLLAVLLIGSAITACEQNGGNTNNTGAVTIPVTTPEQPGSPSFEGMDLNSYKDTTFYIAGPSNSGWTYSDPFLFADSYTGDTVNDAVYERNKQVEDRFGITLEFYCNDNVVSHVRKLIMTDDNPYDAMFMQGSQVIGMLQSGYLKDLNELKYCDFTKDYWDQNCYRDLSVGGKNYCMVSDISAAMLFGTNAVFFNKDLIDEYHLESPYQLVKDNKWTYEKLVEMGLVVSKDLNNDGKWDEHDQYGFFPISGTAMLQNSGVRFTENNAEGNPEVVFLKKDAERTVAAFNLFCDAEEQFSHTYSEDLDVSPFLHIWDFSIGGMFGGGKVMLMSFRLGASELLTNMQSDYGIVPAPKFDEEQSQWCHFLDPNFSVLTIPVTNERMDFTSCVLEYMAYASTDTVVHAFFDKVMKGQRAHDPDTIEMLDIIKNTMTYDFAVFNDIGITSTIDKSVAKRTLTSTFASNEQSIKRRLQTLIDKFG